MTSTERFPLRRACDGGAETGECAVVLLRVEGAQFHLGLRRSSRSGEPVIHLAWHRRLRDEPLTRLLRNDDALFPSAVIALGLDSDLDLALQALSLRVRDRHAGRHSGLAYGFDDRFPPFDASTGAPTDPEGAFTCATFVLALLRSVGVDLVDPDRWRPPTEEDLEWQRSIGDRLIAFVERAIHGEIYDASDTADGMRSRVERALGSRRYRPPDVAGAATLGASKWPAAAQEADPRAEELVALLSA